MEQEIQNTKEHVENQENLELESLAHTPQNLETNKRESEDFTVEDNTENLAVIEPASGETTPTVQTNVEDIISAHNIQSQLQEFAGIGFSEAIGILDETELEYGATNTQVFTLKILSSAVSEEIVPQNPILNTTKTPAIETTLPEANIRLSNATNNQRFINDTDHYQIDADFVRKNHKLFGDEMDIRSVSDNVLVRYNFRTEESFQATLKSDWNAIKNIDIESADINSAFVKNFVHADISLNSDSDKTVKIFDAKRGNIETGSGDDVITIKAFTNGSGWSNTFKIDSGAGNDKITVKGDKGHTITDIEAGAGNDIVKINGDYAYSNVHLGDGNDRFQNGKGNDTIFGEAGKDIIKAGKGDDLIVGGSGDDIIRGGSDTDIAVFSGRVDEYIITKSSRKYTVQDTVEGRDGTDTITGVEGLLFGIDDLYIDIQNNWTNQQLEKTFETQNTEEIVLSDLLDDYSPIQDAIDTFVQNTETGSTDTVQVAGDITALTIMTVEDAILNSYFDAV